jgi:hypothetical protein
MVDSYRQASYILDIRQEIAMTTIARNRIEALLPKIISGKRYTLENYFRGDDISAEQVCNFVRMWTERRSGKMTVDGTKGCYHLHSNHWVEFEVAA